MNRKKGKRKITFPTGTPEKPLRKYYPGVSILIRQFIGAGKDLPDDTLENGNIVKNSWIKLFLYSLDGVSGPLRTCLFQLLFKTQFPNGRVLSGHSFRKQVIISNQFLAYPLRNLKRKGINLNFFPHSSSPAISIAGN